jgi:hypothetical protein
MKIDKINEGMNTCQNIDTGNGVKAGSFKEGIQKDQIEKITESKIREVAKHHDFSKSVTFDESKKITEFMQEENKALNYLSVQQKEEINTIIADYLIKDPILSSKLLTILRGLKE